MKFEQAYFDANYRDYVAQNPRWKLDFYARTLERFASASRPLELLDVGCGLGRFLEFLAARGGYNLHGTDLSQFAIEQNQQRLPGVSFKMAAATDQPFSAGQFDVITACDVIEHVPDLEGVGQAVTAQLKAGGLFMFVVPVYDGLSGPIIHALDKDPTHVHKKPRSFWLSWAAERFEILEWWGMMRYLLPGKLYLHLPTRFWRDHTPAILVVARPRGER